MSNDKIAVFFFKLNFFSGSKWVQSGFRMDLNWVQIGFCYCVDWDFAWHPARLEHPRDGTSSKKTNCLKPNEIFKKSKYILRHILHFQRIKLRSTTSFYCNPKAVGRLDWSFWLFYVYRLYRSCTAWYRTCLACTATEREIREKL